MKKHLTLTALLFLAACGNGEQETAAETTPPPSESASQEANSAPDPAPVATAEQGRKDFNACAVCHSVREGDAARVGPNLFGIYGEAAGQREGFAYSPAMRDSGLTWDDETLDAFIENPRTLISGNRMAFPGQRDAAKRANIIAYLKTLQADAD